MTEYEAGVSNRLKTARGHLGGVIQMVDDGAYCPDVMKQLSAVQGLLEGTSRMVLRRHLQTCVARAMREGRTEAIVDELMETLKFDKSVLRPPAPQEAIT
ncbi:copper-sensing transcriptional repressor CsoR [soil metagenome]|jgi:DNA-binding FrmR family transcriptional regulator|nr:metal-sensitive transcriptional regulator [Euzebyaceae bacterium]